MSTHQHAGGLILLLLLILLLIIFVILHFLLIFLCRIRCCVVSFSIRKRSLTCFPLGKTRHFLCFIRTCCATPLTRRDCERHISCER